MIRTPAPSQFFHVEKVAQVLGITEENTRALLRAGKLPGVRLGKRWLVPIAAINALALGDLPKPH